LVLTSLPAISFRYSFTSEEPTDCTAPSSSRYWNSSWPGSSRMRRTMRASFGSSRAMRWNLPLLPRNWNSMRAPSTFTCRLRIVVRPKESFSSA